MSILTILALTSTIYAVSLQHARRQLPELFDHATVLAATIGVGYTLGILSLDPAGLTVGRMWLGFVASGAPIALRSVYNYLVDWRRAMNELAEHRER